MSTTTFWIPGEPKAQPRPRFNRRTGRAYHAPGPIDAWRTLVALHAGMAAPREPLDGPVCLGLTFLMPRRKDRYRKKDANALVWHTSKIDVDNGMKALNDEMENVGWFVNDSQVCDVRVRKLIVAKSGPGSEPGCIVEVRWGDDMPAIPDVSDLFADAVGREA